MQLIAVFCSHGSGVLEEHAVDRCGIYGTGDVPGQPLPAERHHCALSPVLGYHVHHRHAPSVLQTTGSAALEPWCSPLSVSWSTFILEYSLDLLLYSRNVHISPDLGGKSVMEGRPPHVARL